MLGLAVDLERVGAAAGERFPERRGRIEAGAALVEGGELEIGAEADAAGVGGELAGEQFQQRRLARPIRADDADPVAALDPQREVADDNACPALSIRSP